MLKDLLKRGCCVLSIFSVFQFVPVLKPLSSFTCVEKSEEDIEREARLVEQWVGLTEERNAVLVPAPGSGIPGAPADW